MSKNIAIEAAHSDFIAVTVRGAFTWVIGSLPRYGLCGKVHQPDKPNPLLNVLGDVAFPLLLIAGLLFLRSRAPGGGGIPGTAGLHFPAEDETRESYES